MSGLTYKESGVDIEAGDRLVDRIKPMAARTRIPEVLGGVGGFAGLCSLPSGMVDPIMVSGTDGVGTKLRVAFDAGVHDTVGIDLVAMCVNDVITTGARPLFFLDYFATGKLDVDTAAAVIEGIARGCEQAGCALLGGETAELPGFYAPGEYDLAGFAVGVVERARILDGSAVRAGDAVVAVASSGLHSNGYSLARRALLGEGGLRLDDAPEGLGEPLRDALLRPTKIYARAVAAALETGAVRALCHVTGGGLPGNLPRVLPDSLGARVDVRPLEEPPIFELIRRLGRVDEAEMRAAFNLGVGLVAVVRPDAAQEVVRAFAGTGERALVIGSVEPIEPGATERVTYR